MHLDGDIRQAVNDTHLVHGDCDTPAPALVPQWGGRHGFERWKSLSSCYGQLGEARLEGAELVAPGDVSDLRRDALEMERLGVQLYGYVEAHLRELQRHERALPAFFQLLARALR